MTPMDNYAIDLLLEIVSTERSAAFARSRKIRNELNVMEKANEKTPGTHSTQALIDKYYSLGIVEGETGVFNSMITKFRDLKTASEKTLSKEK